jgi:hypothetical protein
VIIEMPRNLPRSFKEVRDMKLKLVVLVTIVFLGTMILSFKTTSVSDPQSPDTIYPNERASLLEYVQKAKDEGKKKVVISAPIGIPLDVVSLSDALSKLSLIVVQPVAQKSYAQGEEDIITWIKFKIIEDLSQKEFTTALDNNLTDVLPHEVADALLPIGEDEILVPQAGGRLDWDGVTLISETSRFPLLSMDQRYLLFVERSHSGKIGRTQLGPHSVFTISEPGQINPLLPKPHPVSRDIKRYYGDSLNQMKKDIGKRSSQN